MSFLSIFKAAPYAQEIEDPELIKKKYKYWRLRIFYGMYIGYVFYYFARNSFTFAMPSMMKDLGYDKSELGILASVMAVTYGISKFLSGILSDKTNPRYFMAFGLILTGIFNIFFGLSSSIFFFAIFWGLNGWFQGWGWPPCARLLTHWYSQKERGTWWGFWNTSHSVGGALIPIIAALCAQYLGWRYALYLPGAFCILVGLFVLNRLRDTPQSLGLPSIEKYKDDFLVETPGEKGQELSIKQILFKYVLSNRYIWVLAVAYFFVYVIRMALFGWTVLYLVETKNYSLIGAGACVSWFEIGGIFGSLAAGWASDKIFGGRRVPITVLFCIALLASIGILWAVPCSMVFVSLLMFVIGFFIFGPQMLIGMAPAELSSKKAAGSATGFVGLFAYLGAATAGYPLGKMTQEYGWQGFFITITVCGIVAVGLLLPLWSVKSNPKLVKEREEEPVPSTQ